jgi:LemA protein
MKKTWIILGSIVAILVVVGLAVFGVIAGNYNRLVTLSEAIAGQWAEVENQLQRRNDLIPNIVNTVKGYAKHEKEIFTQIAEARGKLAGAGSIREKIDANRQMESALARLLVVVERYPDLKANQNFIRLQDELAGTENRITVARQRFNETVRMYNTTVRRFPANIVAGMFGFEKKDIYFEAAEKAKEVPTVAF